MKDSMLNSDVVRLLKKAEDGEKFGEDASAWVKLLAEEVLTLREAVLYFSSRMDGAPCDYGDCPFGVPDTEADSDSCACKPYAWELFVRKRIKASQNEA